MERLYRVLCIWMVLCMVFMGAAPAASAALPPEQSAQGGGSFEYVPPRPDLMYTLQQAMQQGQGFGLNAALQGQELAQAYQDYLALKLGTMPREDSYGQARSGGGASLQASPTVTGAIVALVKFPDRSNNQIPAPHLVNPDNNTDYWVADFSKSHYEALLNSLGNEWSLRNYFREASYGAYDLYSAINDWTTLPVSSTLYGNDHPLGGVDNYMWPDNPDPTDVYDIEQLVMDAAATVRTMRPPGFWGRYSSDTGTERIVNYFVVVHAGRGQEASGNPNDIWSVRGRLPQPYWITTTSAGNSFYVQDYVVLAEDSPVGVWAHEFGHLFGLPDTWNPRPAGGEDVDWPYQDPGGIGEPSPSFWDVMGQGCWLGSPLGTKPASMNAYQRIALGWIPDSRIVKWSVSSLPRQVHISQLETPAADNHVVKIELPPLEIEGEEGSFEHYYLLEWRNDQAGFDRGLQEAYNMTNLATGKAQYFRYNPGLLIWYVNTYFEDGDNDVLLHPGEGFMLALDSHPDPIQPQHSGTNWRTRVQMQDATFRQAGMYTHQNILSDPDGYSIVMPPLPAASVFSDLWHSYPYYTDTIPYNSAKTPQYGVRVEVTGENPGATGAWLLLSMDAGDLSQSTKTVNRTEAEPGQVLTYTIVLYNNGIADAYTVSVSDTAPAGTTYQPGSYEVTGAPAGWAITETNGIRWQGTVPLGSPVTITFRVTLDGILPDGEIIRNVAYVYEGPELEATLTAETVISSKPCLTGSEKWVEPGAALAGDILTYTIALDNSTGTMHATAHVTDCLPANSTYISGSLQFSDGEGFYNPQTNCIQWTGPVTAGIEFSTLITFQVMINPGWSQCTVIDNDAMVDDGYHPPLRITARTIVLCGPNLVNSTKTVDKALAEPGEELEYTIVITNSGNRQANASLMDLIPMFTDYVTGSASVDYTGAASGALSANSSVVSWSGLLGTLASATIRFRVTIQPGVPDGTIIENLAEIAENNYYNFYTRVATTTVRTLPNLATSSSKEVSSATAKYGDILTYTITLSNTGNGLATVKLTDPIPDGAEYYDGPSLGTYYPVTNTIEWEGIIDPHSSVTLTFAVSVTIETTGVITNVATVSVEELEEDMSLIATTNVAALRVVNPEIEIWCGDVFTVPIRVENVLDMRGFQVKVGFDPSILQIEALSNVGTWFTGAAWERMIYTNTIGSSEVVAALFSYMSAKSGSGDLYYIRFRAVGTGTSPITITESLMGNTPNLWVDAIAHNVIDGSVTVDGRSITGYAYLQGPHLPYSAGATLVNAANGQVLGTAGPDGFYSICPPVGNGQSFTLKVMKDGYLWSQRVVTTTYTGTLVLPDVLLLGGDVSRGTYVPVTSPLTCTPTISTTIPGPPDGAINLSDLAFVGGMFGKNTSSVDWGMPFDVCTPHYIAYRADITDDGEVNVLDLVVLGANYGKIAPSPWP